MAIRHVVLTKFRSETSKEERVLIINLLKKLGEAVGGSATGVLEWVVEENITQPPRRKCDLIEIATFASNEAHDLFRAHPAHSEVIELMKKHCDWWLADYLI